MCKKVVNVVYIAFYLLTVVCFLKMKQVLYLFAETIGLDNWDWVLVLKKKCIALLNAIIIDKLIIVSYIEDYV